MEYSSGASYGYDEINFYPENLNDFLITTDANRLHKIDKINERETRLLKKIQNIQPTCSDMRERYKTNYCKPNLYSKLGSYVEQKRMNERDNIEDYYFSGRERRITDCREEKNVKKSENNNKKSEKNVKKSEKNVKKSEKNVKKSEKNVKKSEKEGFNSMRDELYNMEQKNNTLILLIVFLVIICIVQYTKCSNVKPMVMFLPNPNNPNNPNNKESK